MEIKINNYNRKLNSEVLREGVFVDLLSLEKKKTSLIMKSISGYTKILFYGKNIASLDDISNLKIELYDMEKNKKICEENFSYVEGEGNNREYRICFREDSPVFDIEINFSSDEDREEFLKKLKETSSFSSDFESQKRKSLKFFFEDYLKSKNIRLLGDWIFYFFLNLEKEKNIYKKMDLAMRGKLKEEEARKIINSL